ncbi:MAG TPA: hypothetical protein PKC76_06040 [Saprospiraceae bacterium]|nr:hypothetical protein [Saprospiraceae bacterium]HMP23671.1 hypothetical protein [Saprospiraceae bacterium]
MRILIVSDTNLINPFTKELQGLISGFGEVRVDKEQFWQKSNTYDVLLFQWPEELFHNWNEPSTEELNHLKAVLNWWRPRAKLVIIRHNYHPHYRDSANYAQLYDIVYAHMDGVIHMGNHSKDEYQSRYQAIALSQKHAVIPHLLFTSFPDQTNQIEARKKLGIPTTSFIVLIFGALRHKEEIHFAFKNFRRLRIKNKYLLIAKMPLKKYRGARYIHPIIKMAYVLIPRTKLFFNFQPDDRVQYFFHAADVVLIPRRAPLNSGNVPLGFAFGKVVIGPKKGNVGEILEETGNPTFDFDDNESVKRAVEIGKTLVENNKGEDNLVFATNYWGHQNISLKFQDFLKEIVGS